MPFKQSSWSVLYPYVFHGYRHPRPFSGIFCKVRVGGLEENFDPVKRSNKCFCLFTIVSDVRGSIGRDGTDSATGNSSGKTTLDDVFWTPFVNLLVFLSFFRPKGFLVGRTY